MDGELWMGIGMLYALSQDNQKISASPNVDAVCPSCNESLIPKCGQIKVWHFAHKSDTSCDPWFEPESKWHLNWKYLVKPEYTEVLIMKDGVRHFADIKTPDRIIELQYSPLSYESRLERESFYGAKLIWVINQDPVSIKLHLKDDFSCTFRWMHPKQWIITNQRKYPFFLDLGDMSILKVDGIKRYKYETSDLQERYRTGGWGELLFKGEFLEDYLWGCLRG
jgi:hypothetical protein